MRINKKSKVAVVTAVFVLAGGGAAFAYWTIGGSGTGTAVTGTSVDITAVQTTVVAPMYPGDAPQTLAGNFTNTNTGPVYVAQVTASIASVTQAVGAVGICGATDYTLTLPVMAVNAEVPVGTGTGAWSGATIQFNNKASNQDGCKGATVNLAYAIS